MRNNSLKKCPRKYILTDHISSRGIKRNRSLKFRSSLISPSSRKL